MPDSRAGNAQRHRGRDARRAAPPCHARRELWGSFGPYHVIAQRPCESGGKRGGDWPTGMRGCDSGAGMVAAGLRDNKRPARARDRSGRSPGGRSGRPSLSVPVIKDSTAKAPMSPYVMRRRVRTSPSAPAAAQIGGFRVDFFVDDLWTVRSRSITFGDKWSCVGSPAQPILWSSRRGKRHRFTRLRS